MRARILLFLILTLPALPAAADWIVFLGGGIQESKGPWELRGKQVLFHAPNGTLMSVRAEEVDLAASAFLSWQVGERRHPPAAAPRRGGATAPAEPAPAGAPPPPCLPARVLRVLGPETLELAIDGPAEMVHLDCLDAPDTRHKFPQLAWYGERTGSAVESLLRGQRGLCVIERQPALRDGQGHRILALRLPDGRDLGAELIARGLALAARYECDGGARYLDLEHQARAQERGHWGPSGNDVSVAIVAQSAALGGGPAPPRQRVARGGG